MAAAPAAGEESRRLDGSALARALNDFHGMLGARREHINRINVFPVADADTGSNLFHTMAALRGAVADSESLAEVAGSVRDATTLAGRGASGLILTQALAGMCGVLLSGRDAGGSELAEGLEAAGAAAYAAVGDPVEGTMLTGARMAGKAAAQAAGGGGDTLAVASAARDAAWAAVADSPRVLPTLAAAGVVDSGAVGYALLMDALRASLDGETLPELSLPEAPSALPHEAPEDRYELVATVAGRGVAAELTKRLAGKGSSLAVGPGPEAALVHHHVAEPAVTLDAIRDVGAIESVEVTDLLSQIGAPPDPVFLVVGSDIAETSTLIAAGADRLIVPADAGRLIQSVETWSGSRVVIVAVGEASAAATEAARLLGAEVEVRAVATVAEAAAAVEQYRESGV